MSEVSKKAKLFGILVALYSFFLYVGTASFYGVYAYVPDYVGVSLVTFGTANSVTSIVTALLSFVAAKIISKYGARAMMLFGSSLAVISAILLGLFPSSPTLFLVFAIAGFVGALAGFGCITDACIKIFGDKSPSWIAFAIGAATVGMGVGQGLATLIMTNAGMKWVFLGLNLVSGIIALIFAIITRVPRAEAVSGSDNATQSASAGAVDAKSTVKKSSIFKNPAAWCMFIATFLLAIPATLALSYATAYFPSFGKISVPIAGLMVSIMGLATGFYNMVSGKVMTKMGMKPYAIMIVISMIATCALALLYGSVPQVFVIVLFVLAYMLSGTLMYLPSILSPSLFGLERATEVVTTGVGFMWAGNILAPVVVAWMVSNLGFSLAYSVAIGVAALILVCYISMFAFVKKQQVTQGEQG